MSRSKTQALDLPLAEVLEQFHDGPTTGIFTDGSSRPNPGPGGWGTVYVLDGKILDQRYGHDPDTTNNRMELTALIEGYKMVGASQTVNVYTDSELCVKILTEWAPGWRARGWRKKGGEIKNLELVKELYELYLSKPKAKILWVKAHNGWRWNEYADSLSTAWARKEL